MQNLLCMFKTNGSDYNAGCSLFSLSFLQSAHIMTATLCNFCFCCCQPLSVVSDQTTEIHKIKATQTIKKGKTKQKEIYNYVSDRLKELDSEAKCLHLQKNNVRFNKAFTATTNSFYFFCSFTTDLSDYIPVLPTYYFPFSLFYSIIHTNGYGSAQLTVSFSMLIQSSDPLTQLSLSFSPFFGYFFHFGLLNRLRFHKLIHFKLSFF